MSQITAVSGTRVHTVYMDKVSNTKAANKTRSRYVTPQSADLTRLYQLEAMDENEMTIGENDELCELQDRIGR